MKIQEMDRLITAKMADAVFSKDGLIPVVVQDESTHEVLMVAYMNRGTLVQNDRNWNHDVLESISGVRSGSKDKQAVSSKG